MINPVSKSFKKPRFIVSQTHQALVPNTAIFWVDGYNFGSTLLEGLMFSYQLSPDRKTITVLGVDCDEYLEDLNVEKWMNEALNYLIDADDFSARIQETKVSATMGLFSEHDLQKYYPNLFPKRFSI